MTASPARWRLHRAGIVNVYQYEDEVLHFGGGRLLLRGVNGSGKSTAMNMLLPFLLTARQGRIDAAGEQSGILKSWMLGGRDDAQPVGYLWIEFERDGEFLVCGCGIKANRTSDSVNTWWFVTSRRPRVDLDLVERGVPLSADALRAALDGDEVFGHDRRRDYRSSIERHLFGGASLDQHIGLINVVRSPRVGDRIDVELPEHLVDALPRLSDQALAEAAQPLDDLEEHRRNVAELARTVEAIEALLEIYRAYAATELRDRAEAGRERLDTLRARRRAERRQGQTLEQTQGTLATLDGEIGTHEATLVRLRVEIDALQESDVYREGRQLAPLRDLVAVAARQASEARERVAGRERRAGVTREALSSARRRAHGDHGELNEALASAGVLGERCRLVRRVPGAVPLDERPLGVAPDDTEAREPAGTFEATAVERELVAVRAAVRQRRADLDELRAARGALDVAERRVERAESARDLAADSAAAAATRLAACHRALDAARHDWRERARAWSGEVLASWRAAFGEASPGAVASLARGGPAADPRSAFPSSAPDDVPVDDERILHATLAREAQALIEHHRDVVTALDARLDGERRGRDEAQALVDTLAARDEPDPPRLDWQRPADHTLADLVDFAPHLDDAARAGLEAALQASGLLSARVVDGTAFALDSGELVAVAGDAVPNPLGELLVVTVPARLAAEVDATLVERLLDSISSDPASAAPNAVAPDGRFRVGALAGRHAKTRADLVGASARREALERERARAAEALEAARAVVSASERERERRAGERDEARRGREALPDLDELVAARADVAAANAELERLDGERTAAARRVGEAERESIEASNALQRLATTLALPSDVVALDAFAGDLVELGAAPPNAGARSSPIGTRRARPRPPPTPSTPPRLHVSRRSRAASASPTPRCSSDATDACTTPRPPTGRCAGAARRGTRPCPASPPPRPRSSGPSRSASGANTGARRRAGRWSRPCPCRGCATRWRSIRESATVRPPRRSRRRPVPTGCASCWMPSSVWYPGHRGPMPRERRARGPDASDPTVSVSRCGSAAMPSVPAGTPTPCSRTRRCRSPSRSTARRGGRRWPRPGGRRSSSTRGSPPCSTAVRTTRCANSCRG